MQFANNTKVPNIPIVANNGFTICSTSWGVELTLAIPPIVPAITKNTTIPIKPMLWIQKCQITKEIAKRQKAIKYEIFCLSYGIQ